MVHSNKGVDIEVDRPVIRDSELAAGSTSQTGPFLHAMNSPESVDDRLQLTSRVIDVHILEADAQEKKSRVVSINKLR
jgi:hypothetical protein